MPHRPTLHHPALQLKNNKMENMQNMEYSSTMSSSFDDILNNRPKLGFYQHAVRCDNGWQHIENAKIPKIQKPSTNFDKFNIDFKTLSKWQKYSYFDYYKCFINGYLREIEYEYDNLIIPNGVNQVCIKFFFNEQVHITQIAYKLCPYIGSFNYEILSHQNELKQEINIQGLTGLEIVDQIQTKLNLSEQQTINICNLAIKYGFLRLIGIRRVLAINSYDFYDNDKYLYIFDEGKQSHFTQYIKYQYSHKQTSWNISTEIQYFNNQHNIWQLAKIVAIDSENSDQVLIKPVINHNNINTTKTKLISINRYNPKQIKSTKQYIEKRENWKNNDMINIYNHQNKIWIDGQIKDIKCKSDIENYIDILQINYKYNDKSYIDYISRWSPFIQPSI